MEFGGLRSSFDCLLIDLDDTLYSSSLGIGQACKRNIEEFLTAKCRVSAEKACSLRVELFHSYGSSLAGLIALGYDVHPDEYHSFVHGLLPYERIQPDPQLRELLRSIPQTKIMFTNSDRKHVKRVLGRLGIEEECFDRIVCFETLNFHLFDKKEEPSTLPWPPATPEVILKPSIDAVETAVRLAGFDPCRTLFLDDSERNIASGKAVGLRTALVGKRVKTKAADYSLESIMNLSQAIPEIWGEKEKKGTLEHGLAVRSELDSMRSTTPVEA
ncbi:hypothetical protein COCNU_05G007390 [Cocos nucifera]|uniref:Uncharacterized protein n=1 Tax=Cocos nucifera TaxID=13894 RepID=A0A8K0I8R8_COCNU|nr:hypothetical protein COCNU_05G007390 [Cocos nucifera]